MRVILSTALFTLVFCCGLETGAAAQTAKSSDCRSLAKTYFSKPLKSTIEDFKSYDLNTQYLIYICGNQYMHPPALHLAAPFASQGQKVAAFLSSKLLEGVDDLTVRDILRVFLEMRRQHTYDVRDDKALLNVLEMRVPMIDNVEWRKYAVTLLDQIKRQ